jgi:hypothetical protein
MTPQEQQLLQGLTNRVNQTQLTEKDPDAERYLGDTLGRNPDALYILAQTVLVQQYALDQAKQELYLLKKELDQANLDLDHARQLAQQPKHATSFLGGLLGMNDEPAPPPPPRYAPAPTAQPQQGYTPVYAPPQAYAQPQYAQPSGGIGGMFGGGQPSGGGSFLRSAMTTATGVAAGALAFEGIESLMHGFGQHAGYGGGSGLGGFGGDSRPEVVNNYYNEGAPGEHHGDLSDRLSAAGDQPSPDVEDRRDDSCSTFADTSNDETTDDTADDSTQFADDNSDKLDDNSASDDSGGLDNSGSSDDSSF